MNAFSFLQSHSYLLSANALLWPVSKPRVREPVAAHAQSPPIALVYLGNSQRKGYPHKPLMIHSLKKPQEFIFCVTSIDHDSSSVICLLGLGLLGDIDQVDSFVKSYID